MREFKDEQGRTWVADVRMRPGTDFKGRYYFAARPEPEESGGTSEVRLDDVRWNSEKTAWRTLQTMSDVELRRRLRSARGRSRDVGLGDFHVSG